MHIQIFFYIQFFLHTFYNFLTLKPAKSLLDILFNVNSSL